ncbi:hypothetical protein WJX74_006994 [Apatococcus lobatus]|uniref:Transcription initiation factor IIF subunit beta n=2 Tax=Apatococcus TaxID=904362 RepID=A0AAW1SVL7_9CHLO
MEAPEDVWLVKVPEFVAQQWRAAYESGGEAVELGRVRVVHNAQQITGATDQLQLVMDDDSFHLRPNHGDMAAMHYISQEDGRTCLEGPVGQRLDAEMAENMGLDERYRKRVSERTAATAKQKTMKRLEPADVKKLQNQPAAVGSRSRQEAAGTIERAATTGIKRERADKDLLTQALFKLFEGQTCWTFVQLVKQTSQPVNWLKEVLETIAVKNKRGPNKDLWELKREYKVKK